MTTFPCPHCGALVAAPKATRAKATRASKPGAALFAALEMAARVAERRGYSPTFACVQCTPQDDGLLRLRAADAMDSFEAVVPLEAASWTGGTVVVDAVLLRDAAKAGVLSVAVGGTADAPLLALVGVGGVTRALPGLQPSDFPVWPEAPQGAPWSADAAGLAAALGVVGLSVSLDNHRYGMNGVHWESAEGGCRLVATDSNRLHWCHAAGVGGVRLHAWPSRMLLNRSSAERWARVAKAMDGSLPVTVVAGDRAAAVYGVVGGGRWTIVSRLINGEFPDYRRIIPTEWPREAVFDREEMTAAMAEAAKAATDRHHEVAVVLNSEGVVEMSVSSEGTGIGWSRSIPAEIRMPDATIRIGFDAKMVLDALKLCETTSPNAGLAHWCLGPDAYSATRIHTGDPEAACAIMMPLKLD